MQRYFAKEKDEQVFVLSETDGYHIQVVMRMREGDFVEVVYQQKAYRCSILSFSPRVVVQIENELDQEMNSSVSVCLVQALVKEQKMDMIIQKATELGVHEIIPVQTERSIVKIDSKEQKKLERWNRIAKEASEQCKRVDIPRVLPVISIDEVSKLKASHKLICTVNEKNTNIKTVLTSCQMGDTLIIVIGPEGGFTSSEEEKLFSNGFQPVSLGSRVLRTETASFYFLSVCDYHFMR